MKLKNLEIFIVGNQPPGWGGKYFIFVKLITDNGIVGYGEVYSAAVALILFFIIIVLICKNVYIERVNFFRPD